MKVTNHRDLIAILDSPDALAFPATSKRPSVPARRLCKAGRMVMRQGHHQRLPFPARQTGLDCGRNCFIIPPFFRPLAQSVEHVTFNHGVVGSSPTRPTIFEDESA